ADLVVVGNRVERLEASVKKPRPDRDQLVKELDVVKRVQAALDAGTPLAALGLTDEEWKPLRSFGLLTHKPQVVVANVAEGQGISDALKALAPDALAIDAKLELELSQLG